MTDQLPTQSGRYERVNIRLQQNKDYCFVAN